MNSILPYPWELVGLKVFAKNFFALQLPISIGISFVKSLPFLDILNICLDNIQRQQKDHQWLYSINQKHTSINILIGRGMNKWNEWSEFYSPLRYRFVQ